MPRLGRLDTGEATMEIAGGALAAGASRQEWFEPVEIDHGPAISIVESVNAAGAQTAIADKAASLGVAFTGLPSANIEPLAHGFMQDFANCAIYFSERTGAHEIHGDILRKYLALKPGGRFQALPTYRVVRMGFPTTDETATPDGVGRYNHFANNASIYWHPSTGPMTVEGPVRTRWAEEGWELGRGYPVTDTFSPANGEAAGDFQDGVLWVGPQGFSEAKTASLAPEDVLTAIRTYFDRVIHKSPDNIGLHPNRSLDAVSDTGYGFWQSRNRQMTVTLHGFRDNGLATDTDFAATLGLLFSAETLPDKSHDLTIACTSVRVSARGLAAGQIASGVAKGIADAFAKPIALANIPDSAPLLSLKVGADGSLLALLSPTLVGGLAQARIQQGMNELL